MSEEINLRRQAPTSSSGLRFDQVAAELFPQYSRARLQHWIRGGNLRLAGKMVKPNTRILGGEVLTLTAEVQAEGEWRPQALGLDIIHEDEHILIINKAAGVVVHPAAGNPDGTILNAVLHHAPQLQAVPRAGIVHRLDKDTTGLMVIAKTLEAQTNLVRQLQARTVRREYDAVAMGTVPRDGTVDAPIGRHPRQRVKMAVVQQGGKPAVTHYQVEARFDIATQLRVKLETGRTHQIRVHMAHLGYPLVGDAVYGGKGPKKITSASASVLRDFPRQALHAGRLGLIHPSTGQTVQWRAPWPPDLVDLVARLRTTQE